MRRSPNMNSPVQKGDRHARVAKPLSRPMVLQISRGVGTEVSEADDLRADATWDWENRSGTMSAARRGVDRRSCAVGSRAHSVGHPTEVQRGEHGGVSEREVSDPHSSGVSGAAAQCHGLPLLGAWVLRQHGWFGRRGHPRLHPESRKQTRRNKRSWNLAKSKAPSRGLHHTAPSGGGSWLQCR